jgi:hypothetical protein
MSAPGEDAVDGYMRHEDRDSFCNLQYSLLQNIGRPAAPVGSSITTPPARIQ